MVGAIVIVGSSEPGADNGAAASTRMGVKHGSIASVEMLGRTVLGRTVEELVRGRIDSVAVIASGSFASAVIGEDRVGFFAAPDLWSTAAEKMRGMKDADAILVIRLGAYIEFDPADILQFHREQGSSLTRAFDDQGPLDLWVIDPSRVPDQEDLKSLCQAAKADYRVRGYVNRLASARDVRRLISDGLSARCQFRPQGFEIRPGIWMGQGAQVERGARIVAPAFIGRDSKIADQCLITRCSAVESNSQIDYGTVIEDSSILSNTYVGIGLDLSHAIVDGVNLLNLQHGVVLKISDPVVLRSMRNNRERSGTDGSFLANLELRDMAMSSVPKEGH